MSRSRLARPVLPVLALAALLGACGGDGSSVTSTATPTPAAVTLVSGGAQSGTVGTTLSSSIVVQVTTAAGAPVTGVTVAFSVASGSATLSAASAVSDATGQASTQVTLGASAGPVLIAAAVQGTAVATTITATATEAANASTAPCTPTTLAAGAAVVASVSSVCLDGGTAGAEYAVIPFNGSTSGAARATFVVQASGVDPVTTILASASSAGGLSLGASASISPRRAFEMKLRATERSVLTPQVATARAWYANRRGSSTARLSVIPATVTVGSLVSLNANADDACTNAQPRAGRVMAVGSKAIVVADTLNPAGGYTSADYQSIATTFDTLVDAVDTRNFGRPSDIDGNGHVVLFFTSAVNALTPRNADYYIGGFFYSRDLFPTKATNGLDACAASNVGEMFYLLVPDPSGTINGNAFSKSFVTSAAIATTAHEYQHLINASRRLYINTAATGFEETWLDEGLAHVAEELVFYARAGLAPQKNLDAATLRANNTYRTAFNDEGVENFSRLESYLQAPGDNSPYADDDELETRGATWSFLRWATDHQSAAQETVWQALVNSTTTGLANLRQVYGSDITSLFRDWSTSLLLDDVIGADARYQEPSWNTRSVLGALSSNGTFPLATASLDSSEPTTVTVRGGSAAYLRFEVGAGKTGTVSWTTTGSSASVTVVRLR
jgi:hypothetical protein